MVFTISKIESLCKIYKLIYFYSDNLFMKKSLSSLLIILFCLFSYPLFAEVYMQDAVVSYYAGDFHGKKTSNGERFDMNALTCAHKSLVNISI